MNESQRMPAHVKAAWVALIVALALQLTSGGGGIVIPPIAPTQKATAVTYVYEKDATAIPNGVLAALNTLNRQGIVATTFEKDTKDGSGDTPEQYKVPLSAAQQAGLPALVATAGNKVLKVLKDPKTEQEIIEAVR